MITLAKGLDPATHGLLCDVIVAATGHDPHRVAPLSGPNHAEEIAAGQPAASVIASSDPEIAYVLQRALSTTRFRVYASSDVRGVQLCGAAKNVIAIAAGICDGLGFGDNARSALITRGLAEMTRLGSALGADPRTYAGLAGLGDLVATCTSRHSRNHAAGELLARGVPPRGRRARRSAWSSRACTRRPRWRRSRARRASTCRSPTPSAASSRGTPIPDGDRDAAGARRAGRRVLARRLAAGARAGATPTTRESASRTSESNAMPRPWSSIVSACCCVQRAAVDALARERVVDVADAEDAHLERELGAAQAVGIAAAVEALVMAAHERQLVVEAADVAEQGRAVARVALDDVELGRRQRRRPCERIASGTCSLPTSCSSAATARPRRRLPRRPSSWPTWTASCATRRVCSRVEVSLIGEPGEQARDPGAEQRLLLRDDAVHVDVGAQRPRRRRAREVARERGRDHEERAELEDVPGPEADRPGRAEQIGRDGDREPHEARDDGEVAEPARELERAQRAQREDAVDQRVDADDPPDERAQRDRDARDRVGVEQRERAEGERRDDARRSAGRRGRGRARARAAARAAWRG